MAALSLETIRTALIHARRVGAGEVELRVADSSFTATLLKRTPSAGVAASEARVEAVASEIRSTHVGYFHMPPVTLAPGAVTKGGESVGSVETLGIANEVTVPEAGIFASYLVEEGQAVQFGQVIALMESR